MSPCRRNWGRRSTKFDSAENARGFVGSKLGKALDTALPNGDKSEKMSQSNINYIEATIKYNKLYKCARCGKTTVGDTVRVVYRGFSTDDLKQFLDNKRQTSSHMPDGWSYNGEFNCGCTRR
jgi:hypothetical protein